MGKQVRPGFTAPEGWKPWRIRRSCKRLLRTTLERSPQKGSDRATVEEAEVPVGKCSLEAVVQPIDEDLPGTVVHYALIDPTNWQ